MVFDCGCCRVTLSRLQSSVACAIWIVVGVHEFSSIIFSEVGKGLPLLQNLNLALGQVSMPDLPFISTRTLSCQSKLKLHIFSRPIECSANRRYTVQKILSKRFHLYTNYIDGIHMTFIFPSSITLLFTQMPKPPSACSRLYSHL